MGFAGALQFVANASSFPYRLVSHTHEGQEGLDTLMVLTQLWLLPYPNRYSFLALTAPLWAAAWPVARRPRRPLRGLCQRLGLGVESSAQMKLHYYKWLQGPPPGATLPPARLPQPPQAPPCLLIHGGRGAAPCRLEADVGVADLDLEVVVPPGLKMRHSIG